MRWEQKLTEYRIRAGRVGEIRQTLAAVSPNAEPARRGTRAKASTAKKLLANEQSAVKALARIINANFGCGDAWTVFKWPEGGPASKEQARASFEPVLRKLRAAYKKATGKSLRYVLAPSDRDGRSGRRVKPHIHIVMDRVGYELLCGLWQAEYINYIIIDGRGDYTGIARYMCGNASGGSGERMDGKKRWSCSKGLKKPRVDEPVPCLELGRFAVPKGATIVEREIIEDEETGRRSAYCRYVLPPEFERGASVIKKV